MDADEGHAQLVQFIHKEKGIQHGPGQTVQLVHDDQPDIIFLYVPQYFGSFLGAVGKDLRAALDKFTEMNKGKPPMPAFLVNVGPLVGYRISFLMGLFYCRYPDDGQGAIIFGFPNYSQGAFAVSHGVTSLIAT
jgi:hypothetical protein